MIELNVKSMKNPCGLLASQAKMTMDIAIKMAQQVNERNLPDTRDNCLSISLQYELARALFHSAYVRSIGNETGNRYDIQSNICELNAKMWDEMAFDPQR